MKYIIALFSLFLVLTTFGANPAFQDFNGNQFGTAGNKVAIKIGVVTTNQVFVGTNAFNYVIITNVQVINWIGTIYADSFFATNGYVGAFYGDGGGLTNLNVQVTNVFATNVYATNIYSSNIYSTTIYAISNFVENLFATNFYSSNIFTTNLTVYSSMTVNSNLTVNGKFTVNNIYALDTTITNGLYFVTNNWPGPTNDLDLRVEDQYYDTLTPMSITGFVNKSNTVSESVILSIRNISSTNVELWLPPGVIEATGTNNYLLVAGTTNDFVTSIRYSPAGGGRTNAVHRRFWR